MSNCAKSEEIGNSSDAGNRTHLLGGNVSIPFFKAIFVNLQWSEVLEGDPNNLVKCIQSVSADFSFKFLAFSK